MNCIDAVEGTTKLLLINFLEIATEYRMDASEYIRNVKAVIDSVLLFIQENPEISDTPNLIKDELYDFAKLQWLTHLEDSIDPYHKKEGTSDQEYQAYCYDYLYNHGNYPR